MGSSNWQIITKVLLPEAKPSLIVGSTIAVTTILGYSAMAGFVGGGGLGAIAINYGYYRYQTNEDALKTAVDAGTVYGTTDASGAIKVQGTRPESLYVLKAIKNTTMPDGQYAIKFQVYSEA